MSTARKTLCIAHEDWLELPKKREGYTQEDVERAKLWGEVRATHSEEELQQIGSQMFTPRVRKLLEQIARSKIITPSRAVEIAQEVVSGRYERLEICGFHFAPDAMRTLCYGLNNATELTSLRFSDNECKPRDAQILAKYIESSRITDLAFDRNADATEALTAKLLTSTNKNLLVVDADAPFAYHEVANEILPDAAPEKIPVEYGVRRAAFISALSEEFETRGLGDAWQKIIPDQGQFSPSFAGDKVFTAMLYHNMSDKVATGEIEIKSIDDLMSLIERIEAIANDTIHKETPIEVDIPPYLPLQQIGEKCAENKRAAENLLKTLAATKEAGWPKETLEKIRDHAAAMVALGTPEQKGLLAEARIAAEPQGITIHLPKPPNENLTPIKAVRLTDFTKSTAPGKPRI